VIDAHTGKSIGMMPDTPGVHGIAIAPEFRRGFSSNGREDRVSMFDAATLRLINKIDVGKGPTRSTTIRRPRASSLTTTARPTSWHALDLPQKLSGRRRSQDAAEREDHGI
jgi:hypothetical protein